MNPWAPRTGLARVIFRIPHLGAYGRTAGLRRRPKSSKPGTLAHAGTQRSFVGPFSNGRRQWLQTLDSQKQRSALRLRRRGHCRFVTASCWLRARFSKAGSWALAGQTRRREIENRSLDIQMNIGGAAGQGQLFEADVILANHIPIMLPLLSIDILLFAA